MFGRLPQWSHPVLDFCLQGVFKIIIIDVFHFYWSVCLNYLFLLDSVLAGCMFLETCPFLLGCLFCWHITVHSNFFWLCVFLWYRLLFLLFYFLFCSFGSSLFSSWWAWLEVCQFCLSVTLFLGKHFTLELLKGGSMVDG